MPTTIFGANAGPRMTVSMMMKNPAFLPRRVIQMTDNAFITEAVLRQGDQTLSGVVVYYESTPLYSADDPQVMDEFGEIPTTTGSLGLPRVARAVRRALALRVSKTDMDRNSADKVTTQMTQIRNTMVRAWEDALFSALVANANVQTLSTDTAWGNSGSHIRKDVNAAKFVIANAASDSAGKQKFGFVADTLIISTLSQFDFLNSSEVQTPYVGSLATESLLYTGKLPNKFLDLDVIVSWRLSTYVSSAALVMQRKVVGAISDERSLSGTPMYPLGGGGNGGPREMFRSDITRSSAIAIDQPLAACFITGVTASETAPATGGAT